MEVQFCVLEVSLIDSYPTYHMGQIKMDFHHFESSTAICAQSYRIPISLKDYLKFDGLTGIGCIPYSFVLFNQSFLALFCQMASDNRSSV